MKFNYIKLLIVLFLITTQNTYSQNNIPSVNIKTLDGKPVNSRSIYNKNGLTVYSFWATWCVPCINELDDIHKEIEKWNEANVKIVAISTDDSRTKRRIRPLISGKKWGFKILLDENQDLKRALNINGIPHTIVTNGNKIIYRRIGYKPGEENDLYQFIVKNSKSIN
tara:strand:- start:385 stop:885 length:501 start_codon:yes stop_codon:yes gene_type:complete